MRNRIVTRALGRSCQAAARVTRFWRRLAVLQTRRPAVFALGFLVLAGLGLWRATRLRLVTDFADLLSPDQPSVVELHWILARTRGLSTVHLLLEGPDPGVLRVLGDALVLRLPGEGAPFVESARDGMQAASRFLRPRAGLFLSDADMDTLEQHLGTEERRVFRHAIGADLDADDAAGSPPPAPGAEAGDAADGRADDDGRNAPRGSLDAEAIEKALLDKVGALDRYPDGYFQASTPTGFALVVEVKVGVVTGDLAGARAALGRIEAIVGRVMSARLSSLPGVASVRIGYAGDLLTSLAEYELVSRDVSEVGGVGAALVLGAVLLFFRSPVALVTLGLTVGAGCAMTFGVTELALGHLNVATAFLFSIVMGNGVNFGIIWLARFIEERRAGQSPVRAIELALGRTSAATLTAAAAAATAYAALGVGRFRGFRHFAFIGATGMLLCWLSSLLLLPPLVVLADGWQTRRRAGRGGAGAGAGAGAGGSLRPPAVAHFEAPFVWVVARAPRAVLALCLGLGLVACAVGGRYLVRGALEYDMHHLLSDRDTTSELYRVSDSSQRVLDGGPRAANANANSGMVVLTDDARDTPVVAAILRRTRDAAPAGLRPFADVHTLNDLVPPDQAARLVRLRALRRRLIRAHDRGAIPDATWVRIAPLLPPPDLGAFRAADLPPELLEPFTERDSTRGRILYIEQTRGESDSNLHYLIRLADAFRRIRLPDGRVVLGSGRAVIFADLLRASLVDMPRSVLLSLALTAVTVSLLFRRARAVGMVLGSLGLALVWMLAAMDLVGVRLNFINFIALPITFGIGVDYAVNVYGRFEQERSFDILPALRGVGGAVILCSLTTSLGYLALLRSHNQAVRSLGAVAVLGEVSCLTAALLAVPAALVWSTTRRRRPAQSGARHTVS
jgi:predicted RND superfamily exporter protein